MKLLLTFVFALSFLLMFSCSYERISLVDTDEVTSDYFDGIYLSDNVFFPSDTVVIKKFQLSDSSAKRQLLLHFRNDSLYLSSFGFDG